MSQQDMHPKPSPGYAGSKRGVQPGLFSYFNKEVLRTLLVYAVIYVVTFGVLLPYFCSTWVYSPYYSQSTTDADAEAILLKANTRRRDEAFRYLSTLNSNTSRSWHLHRLADPQLDIAIVIITVDRSTFNTNPRLDHLTQTVTSLDREIQSGGLRGGILVCNVDPHLSRYEEAVSLSTYYPTVQRTGSPLGTGLDIREHEKLDYVFCLRAVMNVSLTSRYVLVVEDDAESYVGMLTSLAYVLKNRVEHLIVQFGLFRRTVEPWLFLKLYYPERWSGFGWDWTHLGELVLIGCVTGTIGLVVVIVRRCGRRRMSKSKAMFHYLLAFVYGVALARSVGRQHLMQLRRMSPYLMTVREAPDCCTPAVLFPRGELEQVTRFLDGVTCKSNFGLDLALDRLAADRSLRRLLVEPNLFHHRGFYSTLTKPKQRVEFLFDV